MNQPNDLPIIFIVGASRSGTTMMSRILGRNRQVFTFRELHFFEQIWNVGKPLPITRDQTRNMLARLITIQRDGYMFQGSVGRHLPETDQLLATLPEKLTAPEIFASFLRYETQLQGKSIACDQTPRNAMYAHEILAFYPRARVISMARDPRDVLLSQKSRWKRRELTGGKVPMSETIRYWANYHPITMSMLWNSAVQSTLRLNDHPRLRHLRFEDFIQHPEEELKKLCAFLEIEYDAEMLNVPQVGSSHGIDQPDEVGINPAIAGRWQKAKDRRAADLILCQRISAENMIKLGYESAPLSAGWIAIIALYVSWLPKAGIAALLNIGKSKNIFAALARRIKNFTRRS
jgi:hypothetical protein